MNTAQYASIYEQLYELEGLNFYIQPKSVYFGKNTLQTTYSGGPVLLGTKSPGNSQQLFYFQFLPLSTGIPYLIKSYASNQPIGVGSYASNPNNYVLYTKNHNSNSLFGFSWDFYLNNNENGYIIENQDVVGSGGGSWWDIYHYAIQSHNGSLSMVKRNNASIYQQFNIVPNDMFNVQSVQLDFNDVIIKNTAPYVLRSGTVNNNTSNNITNSLTFTESKGEQSNFRQASGITTNLTSSRSVGINFEVVNIGGSYSVQQGISQTVEYGSSETRSISVSESYTLIVPPKTTVTYQFKAMRHLVDIGYTAQLYGVGTGKTINVKGMYSGVDYSSTYLDVVETPLSGGLPKKYTVIFEQN